MPYDPDSYRSKNVYLPIELCKNAEQRADNLYMNFSVYVRHLIVLDLEKQARQHPQKMDKKLSSEDRIGSYNG